MFGVSRTAIVKGLRSRGISKGSRLDEVRDEADSKAREERSRKVTQANLSVENYAKYNDIIVKLAMGKVIEANKNNNLATITSELLALKTAAQIVERTRIENWSILKIDDLLGDEAELPDLNVGEYSEEELDEIRAQNDEAYLESIDDSDEDFGENDED